MSSSTARRTSSQGIKAPPCQIEDVKSEESVKSMLECFTLEQLHGLCREYKREMRQQDYADMVVLGETDGEIIKKRFIPHVVRFFERSEVLQYAKKFQIKIG